MIRRLSRSVWVRSGAALAVVLVGYWLLHDRFSTMDVALARFTLTSLGFHVSSPGGGDLVVHTTDGFSVYAIVTGSCSSAAGVLGLGAVSFVLLPGPLWRRAVGGVLAACLFVVCNLLRICSIILFGWWLSSTSREVLLFSLLVPTLLALPVVVLPHRRLLLRVGSLLVGGVSGLLAYGVWDKTDYLQGMVSYHGLAGPMLTFGTLAVSVILLWRVIVGSEGRSSMPREVEA